MRAFTISSSSLIVLHRFLRWDQEDNIMDYMHQKVVLSTLEHFRHVQLPLNLLFTTYFCEKIIECLLINALICYRQTQVSMHPSRGTRSPSAIPPIRDSKSPTWSHLNGTSNNDCLLIIVMLCLSRLPVIWLRFTEGMRREQRWVLLQRIMCYYWGIYHHGSTGEERARTTPRIEHMTDSLQQGS